MLGRQIDLRLHETTQHQQTATLHRFHGRTPRHNVEQRLFRGFVVVANTTSMGSQLIAHQRHSRADESAQMLATRRD
ncbi:hypothetical protein D9M70_607490 [compost metagenome]